MGCAALAIAGVDPTAGAGLLLDVSVFELLGCRPYGVPALLTAQNSLTFDQAWPVDPEVLHAELDAVLADSDPACVKVGAVGDAENAGVVAEALSGLRAVRRRPVPVVVDPVRASSTGGVISERYPQTIEILAAVADLITPNVEEAQVLSGLLVSDIASAGDAARSLADTWGCSVCVTGVPHPPEDPQVADVLWAEGRCRVLSHPVLRGVGDPRGTGCLFSTACAAALGCERGIVESVTTAQGFVVAALSHTVAAGRGRRQVDIAALVRDETVLSICAGCP